MNKAPAFLLSIIVFVALLSFQHTRAQFQARTYDWIVAIETQELKNYLNYQGSSLKPMVKVTVTYKETEKSGAPVPYQDLWYRGCDATGSKRHGAFKVRSGDSVVLHVKHKGNTPGPGESCAAANAIVRTVLDAYLNGNSVPLIMVPDHSFHQIIQDLHRSNFHAAAPVATDTPEYSTIELQLQSEPGGSKQTMHYAGRTTDF